MQPVLLANTAPRLVVVLFSCVLLLSLSSAYADGWDPGSSASTIGSIANTRHNLTVSYNANRVMMDIARNNYGAICIYCHTPHGANKQIAAPLWNRTINPGNYTLYDKPTTLMRPISMPGPNSLTCLSCHDGTIAIDSILNMPGSGGAGGNNEVGTGVNAFLDSWAAAGQIGPTGEHFVLGPSTTSGNCTFCHNQPGGITANVPDYRVFALGTDLRDDHPIGVLYPTDFTPGAVDFNQPSVVIPGKWSFFDDNGNGIAEKNEVRLYDSGEGPEVECASCHDPHGIPSNGPGTRFNPSFLRVNNGISGFSAGETGIRSAGPSALCLVCHAK